MHERCLRARRGRVIVVDGDSPFPGGLRNRRALSSSPWLRGGGQLLRSAGAHGDWLVFLHADTWLEPGWAGPLEPEPALVRRLPVCHRFRSTRLPCGRASVVCAVESSDCPTATRDSSCGERSEGIGLPPIP
jgi:hypothetical protein